MYGLMINELKNVLVAFICTWGLQLLTGITVRNPLTLLYFALFWILGRCKKNEKYDDKKGKMADILWGAASIILSGSVTFFIGRKAVLGFDSGLFRLVGILIIFAGMFLVFVRLKDLPSLIKNIFSKDYSFLAVKGMMQEEKSRKELPFSDLTVLGISAVICFLCYLPYFLYEYPGIMTADSLVQYEQIIGVTPWSNHHPVAHTLVISFFYKLGLAVTGDINKAISFYTVAQMIFMSLCCGAVVLRVKRIVGGLVAPVLSLIFFALVPFNAVFAVTLWKDVPFAGIVMLTGCLLVDMAQKDRGVWSDLIMLFVLLVLLSLFRSNGWYAFLLCIPFMLYFYRDNLIKIAVMVAASVLAVIIIKGPVMTSAGVIQPDFTESLSLPLQQVARVLVNDRALSDEDMELITDVIDTTYIHELYAPDFADNIKELVRAGHPEVIENNKGTYLGLWLTLFAKYPIDYIKAWFDLVGGYVYTDFPYDVGNVDGIMANDHGLVPTPLIGGKAVIKGKEILIKLGSFVPIYGMLWCAGAYTWLVIFALIAVLKNGRNKKLAVIMILQAAMIATLLVAAPVIDFRYEYAVVMLMPLTVSICVIIKSEKTAKEY